MHLLTTTSASLDDLVEPVDLGQTPGEMVVASFTDSDLAALAAAWEAGDREARVPDPRVAEAGAGAAPSLRLAHLRDLRHPMSADLWIDKVAVRARIVVLRLLGGLDWWRYGAERLAGEARARGIALALLPGEDRDDPRLAALSTLPADELDALLGYFRAGGPANMRALLARMAGHTGREVAVAAPLPVPLAGFYEWRASGAVAPSPSPPRGEGTVCTGEARASSAHGEPGEALAPPVRGVDEAARHPEDGGSGPGERRASAPGQAMPAVGARSEAASTLASSSSPQLSPRREEGAACAGEACASSADGEPAEALAPPGRGLGEGRAPFDDGMDSSGGTPVHGSHAAASPVIPVIFYRSMWLAGDTAPVEALCAALAARGLDPRPIFVASLREPASIAFLAAALDELRPAVIVTLTAFAAGEPGEATVLDAPGVPVLQAVVATTRREAWAEGARGLVAADLAMHVVLPELDGRVLAGAVSFKVAAARHEELGFASLVNDAALDRVAQVAERVVLLARLQATPPAARRIAVLMPDYAGAPGRTGWAVGLDVPASVRALLGDLAEAGYGVEDIPADERELLARLSGEPRVTEDVDGRDGTGHDGMERGEPGTLPLPDGVRGRGDARPAPDVGTVERGEAGADAAAGSPGRCSGAGDESGRAAPGAIRLPAAWPLTPPSRRRGEGLSAAPVPRDEAAASLVLPLDRYRAHLAALPPEAVAAVTAAWGDPAADPDVVDGAFRFRASAFGNVTVAIAPDRGRRAQRRADYHDPALPPRHALLAFGLWLRHGLKVDALVHMGAHGTLEWLPGKHVALTGACFPELVLGALPVVYPFIVSNPGEAAQAKRRIAAVTLGHLPPPLVEDDLAGDARELERLVDEYAQADGLDRRRRERLAGLILAEAERTGLALEAGARGAAPDEALKRLDAWLCDLKEMRLKDGLHVYGRGACGEAERAGLLAALDGHRVAAGPAGAPGRGRTDVLPTGRNLFTADPRTLPTPTALDLGRLAADEVLRGYLQAHGEWPRALVLDLWGSASLRTGGEEIAQGLALMGCRPVWDNATGRVTGIEVLPTAAMGRPRVDVTFRISGLFRDLFPAQIALLDAAIRAVAAREEGVEENPLAAARDGGARIFGTAPGAYGAGYDGEADPAALGDAYLASASHAYGGPEGEGAATADFAARVASADLLVHIADDPGRDLLEGSADLDFIGGFAAAAQRFGRTPDLVVLDSADPARPRARPLAEALARIVRGRVHPRFVTGLMRHGPRGASEMAETVDRLVGFAEVTGVVPGHLVGLLHEAYVQDPAVRAFLAVENPAAARVVAARLADARAKGLWHPRRNDVDADLARLSGEAAE
ncbi:cobaltochelatase subunit CobN [Ancylobacter terrae]|uniref:cobaltochelatase subunit CobN n=1 Tax=Ancylobacter sp. sgz301288 TaxID=3342077 RepID=UPI0038580701